MQHFGLLLTNHPEISKWFFFFFLVSTLQQTWSSTCFCWEQKALTCDRFRQIPEFTLHSCSPCQSVKVLLCLLIQSFIHETCIKYLLCPRPSAKHEGDRPEIRHGPCSEGIHILLCTTDLSQQLKPSGQCYSRYLLKHQEIGGSAPIHLREVQEKSDIWAGFCRMSRSSPNRQGKEECCWKGTVCAKTHQFTVSHPSLGIRIP